MIKRTEQFQDRLARLFPSDDPTKDSLAKNVTFQVTDGCNLACTYCYQISKHNHFMKFETAKKFIDMLLDEEEKNEYVDSYESAGLIMEFIGGEPFLAIDLIDQIVDYFIRAMIERQHPWATRYMISICSNGLLYFDEKVQKFIRKHLHHLSFSISIDGNKRLHDACRVKPDGSGSYDIAMAGVRHFVDVLGGSMGSKMTLAPQNVMYTYEAVTSIIENGYDEINLNCVYEEGWTPEHALILYQELKRVADYLLEKDLDDSKVYLSIFVDTFFKPKQPDDVQNWCGGNGRMISIDWKGDIYPCIRYMESSLGDSQKPMIIGNVDRGIMKCPEECEFVRQLKEIDRKTQSTEECFNCPIAEGCSWCSAYNYQVFGTVNKRATYICIMHKARALANWYYWAKLYKKQGKDPYVHYIPDEMALEVISQEELDMLKSL